MKIIRSKRTARRHRQGVVLVCVLACMLIAITLAASTVHMALKGARASKLNLRSRQTQWLLQAGMQRARQGLQNPDYTGEVWIVPATHLADLEGRVTISVKPLETSQQTSDRQVTITAEYGSTFTELTRRHHVLNFTSASREAPLYSVARCY